MAFGMTLLYLVLLPFIFLDGTLVSGLATFVLKEHTGAMMTPIYLLGLVVNFLWRRCSLARSTLWREPASAATLHLERRPYKRRAPGCLPPAVSALPIALSHRLSIRPP